MLSLFSECKTNRSSNKSSSNLDAIVNCCCAADTVRVVGVLSIRSLDTTNSTAPANNFYRVVETLLLSFTNVTLTLIIAITMLCSLLNLYNTVKLITGGLKYNRLYLYYDRF